METIHLLLIIVVAYLLIRGSQEPFDVAEDEINAIMNIKDESTMRKIYDTMIEKGNYQLPLQESVMPMLRLIVGFNQLLLTNQSVNNYMIKVNVNTDLIKRNLAFCIRKIASLRVRNDDYKQRDKNIILIFGDTEMADKLTQIVKEISKIKIYDLSQSMGIGKDQLCNYNLRVLGTFGESEETTALITFVKTYMTVFSSLYQYMLTNLLDIARNCGSNHEKGFIKIKTLLSSLREITITEDDRQDICQSQLKQVSDSKAKISVLEKSSNEKDLEISSLKSQRMMLVVVAIITTILSIYGLFIKK